MTTPAFAITTTARRPLTLHLILLALLTSLTLFTTGCATVGQDFPAARVSEIQIGKTTQQDIKAMFGSPWRVGVENGQRTWTYGRYYYSAGGQKHAQDLVVRFDARDVVIAYTYSTTDHDQ